MLLRTAYSIALRIVAGVKRRQQSSERYALRSERPAIGERPRCGARCRDGHACEATAVWLPGAPEPRNGRCRVHGGLSSGPRTVEGRARVGAATRARNMNRTGRNQVMTP